MFTLSKYNHTQHDKMKKGGKKKKLFCIKKYLMNVEVLVCLLIICK